MKKRQGSGDVETDEVEYQAHINSTPQEGDANISKDAPPLYSKDVPMLTPNMRQTGMTTMHSTAYKGTSHSKHHVASPDTDGSTALHRRYKSPENAELDDSLNDRITPEKAEESKYAYATPSGNSRFTKSVVSGDLLIVGLE